MEISADMRMKFKRWYEDISFDRNAYQVYKKKTGWF